MECTHAKCSAGGLDGWGTQELKLTSPMAAYFIAEMLNTIENGASWPKATLHAKAAFLAKEGDSLDPLNYRILSILPVIYRRWASMRLQHLAPWVDSFALPQMYAGIPGRGAEDA